MSPEPTSHEHELPDAPVHDGPALTCYLLGTVDIEPVLAAQRRLVFEFEESGQAALILCEHTPALTIGRQGSRAHLLPDDDELKAEGLAPKWLPRGGGCWLHQPGQVAGYLIGSLDLLGGSAEAFLDLLEQALVRVLADFDVPALPVRDHAGLFVGSRRVAAVGVGVLRNMVHFGFLLNVGPYLRPFDQIEEPGMGHETLKQTSMEAVRVRPVPPARLRSRLVQELRETFRLAPGPVFTESGGFSPLPEVARNHVSG